MLPGILPRWLAAAACAALLYANGPAAAASVQFPLGNHLGLVPPPGLRLIGKAPGFRDPDHNVSLLLLELPPGAYEQVRRSMSTDAAKQRGVILDRRQTLFTDLGAMLLSAGEDTRDKSRKWMVLGILRGITALISIDIPDAARSSYSDDAILAALKTLTLRDPPLSEQLDLLPFRLGDLAGYRVVAVMNRRAVVLTKGDKDDVRVTEQPRIAITVNPMRRMESGDRARIAQLAFEALPGLADRRITNAESIRVDGQPAFEIRADAKDPMTGMPITVVQWLRFGTSVFVQIVGVTSKRNWSRDFPDFRTVRDGIGPKS